MVGTWNVVDYYNCHRSLHNNVKWCSEPQTWFKRAVNALVKARLVKLLFLKTK